MKLLLDTCTFLWLETDPSKVSARAMSLVSDPANTLYLSVVSVWEAIVKVRIGKLKLKDDVADMVRDQVNDNGVRILRLRFRHVLVGRTLPLIHHDPFDRMLVCQAIACGMRIVTPDHNIHKYPVPTEW